MAMKNFLYSYAANLRCFTGLASMMQRYEIFMIYARKNTIIFQKNADSEVLTIVENAPALQSRNKFHSASLTRTFAVLHFCRLDICIFKF